ncbi:MAG TPA: hypothetical protein VK387_04760, partial [Thermoleophilaceae bacterium]|nr:hypothetical protein [Thermoleophilaceae bacterium]
AAARTPLRHGLALGPPGQRGGDAGRRRDDVARDARRRGRAARRRPGPRSARARARRLLGKLNGLCLAFVEAVAERFAAAPGAAVELPLEHPGAVAAAYAAIAAVAAVALRGAPASSRG